jgi:hypothetical protein
MDNLERGSQLVVPHEIEKHLTKLELRYVRKTLRTAQDGSNRRNAWLLKRVGLNFFCYQRAAEFYLCIGSLLMLLGMIFVIFAGGPGQTIGFSLIWFGMFLALVIGGFRMFQASKVR